MALADSVPGVSGGTIAFLLGFYDSFINSLNAENGYMELLSQLDYLVDGPFILSQRSLELKFMGSRNQRFIDVQKSLKEGCAVVIEPY